jgi:hypothetical protein
MNIQYHATRQGTILIIVAGISALLASLALAFIAKTNMDSEETRVTLNDAQARIMLMAACNYIQECSRIGWDRYPRLPTDPVPGESGALSSLPKLPTETNDVFPGGGGGQTVRVHEETFGWIDVRDGSIGPKWDVTKTFDQFYGTNFQVDWTGVQRRCWPAINGIARCPMYVRKIPPYATALTACYNPISTNFADPNYLMPYLRNPDPRPAGNLNWNEFVRGDATPISHTTNKAWFRVLREGPSTFLITCGSGGTQGFHNYQEAVNQGRAAEFNNDARYFSTLSTQEIRLWYRVEWSAAAAEGTYHWQLHHTQKDGNNAEDSYFQWAVNASSTKAFGNRSPSSDKNMGGTFRWIMRLRNEPTNW